MNFLAMGDAGFFLFGGFGLLILLVLGVLTVFWLWMLVDCLTNDTLEGNERLVWALVIFFSHFIGSILYFALVRSKRSGPPRLSS